MLFRNLRTFAFLFITALCLVLTSCHKEPFDANESETENFLGMLFDDFDDDDDDDDDHKDDDYEDEFCFDFVFPLSVDFPDNGIVTYDADSTFWDAIDTWYETSILADSLDPQLVFPVVIELYDGMKDTLENEEQLFDIYYECEDKWEDDDYDHDGDHDDDDKDDHDYDDDHEDCEYDDDFFDGLGECYALQYPIQFIVDTVTFTVDSDVALDSILYEIYELLDSIDLEDVDAELIYPITITDLSNDMDIIIESEEDIEGLYYACEIQNLCFKFNYPITLVDGDGNTQEVNSDEELIAAYVAYDLNSDDDDDEELLPVFPLTVTLDDGTVLTKDNLVDLEALYEHCD